MNKKSSLLVRVGLIATLLFVFSDSEAVTSDHLYPRVQGPGFSDPEKEWPKFFSSLRAAVKKRDRAALKKMMSRDFFYSLGHHASDRREEAFAYWDQPYVRGWKALDRTLAQGTAKAAAWLDPPDEEKLPRRIAPAAANSRRNILRGAIAWYAVFEFRKDGRWYWVIFMECCD